ncbi:MAG: putative membrane protein [Candidatus Paceibacteria bacterium]|jgi:putative membrane protein
MMTLNTLPASGETWDSATLPIGQWIGLAGAALIALLLISRLIQGVLQADRYRAASTLDDVARAQLSVAIEQAEKKTNGEIAVVVVERSDRHPAAHWISGLLWLVLGSALAAHWMPWEQPALFFCIQLGFGALGMALALALPGYRRGLVSEERATEMAQEQSLQEFFGLGLHKTSQGTGVLLFVSLFERRVIVLGDEGIDAKVEEHLWEQARNSVLEGVGRGELQSGLQQAVEAIGGVLAANFPPLEDNPNELPNHVIVRRE